MKIEEIKEAEGITLKVNGRIDTNTSTQLQAEVLKVLQKSSNLVIDLEDTDYVSSAGLRTFLIAYKTAASKGGKFVLKNVSAEIQDVLRKSGFTKLLEIE